MYTSGDAENPATWSNIPWFLVQSLRSKGIEVHNVDISPISILNKIYNRTWLRLAKLFFRQTTFDYTRSWIHDHFTKAKIKKNIRIIPDADAHIILAFSFPAPKETKSPVVHLCDWTLEHFIRHYRQREADGFERAFIRREQHAMQKADMLISLFPAMAKELEKQFGKEKALYLGHVINSMEVAGEDVYRQKQGQKKNLLFIGGRKYLEGAKSLLKAYSMLREQHADIRLNFIGISEEELGELPEGVQCHGYLDKGKKKDREIYYHLLRKANIFINTHPHWGAYSACVEAMYFYNPVILAPYAEFVAGFGEEIKFGRYVESGNVLSLSRAIEEVLFSEDYDRMCFRAQEAVMDFSWENFTDKLLAEIRKLRD